MRIEEKLKISEIQSTNSGLLWSQWNFDKQLLSQALSTISTIFPHYSLHESSHSLTILFEIEKILGPNVEKLSFIDAWLLLECAYWHDIGMVVSNDEKHEILQRPDFIEFLNDAINSQNDLSQYAIIYNDFIDGKTQAGILETERAFTFLLAEYIRINHHGRSKTILNNPESIGIKSPQTGLINKRLFTILGEILETHGNNFDSVMNLPYENDGLEAGDVAHPRFIACLLRIGDLLDLDDGRHCPTQIKAIGHLPALSEAHFEKHRSIVSKTVNESSIEIKAKCTTYSSFELQNDWFYYIESEIENQDRYWRDIAPKDNIWKLPILKHLICDLENSITLEKKSSRLLLDASRVYGFLNGKHIYKNPLACILELLQNAADAITDRLWLEKQDVIQSVQHFRSLLNNYTINVEVLNALLPDNRVQYTVSITDNGKGMSLEEIKSILTVASNDVQKSKNKLRRGMPDWMRPSGFFGIGLQSVFSVTDELKIKTKSASDSLYELTIRTTKGKTPSYVIQRKESADWKFGTTVTFKVIDDAIPKTFSGKFTLLEGLSKFDPLHDSVLNIVEKKIEEQVIEFSQYCGCQLILNKIKLDNKLNQFQIVDEQNGIEYVLEFMQSGHINEWAFRGIPFETNSHHKYFNIKGNIISETADSYLSLSREKIHHEGEKRLSHKIKQSLLDKRDAIIEIINNEEIASLYYFLNDKEYDSKWKSIKISEFNLSELIEVGKRINICFDWGFEIEDDKNIVITNRNNEVDILLDVLYKLNFGIKLHNIFESTAKLPYMTTTHKVVTYEIEVVINKSSSLIENSALTFLSSQKLSKLRSRYWLPCGESQMNEISINSKFDYPWIQALTPISHFFPKGIILRSTAKNLEEDLPTLIEAIKKVNVNESEARIEECLREFYKLYPFESIDYKKGFME